MAPIDLQNWDDLSEEEKAQIKEELRISRELRSQQSNRVPYLPSFSGDSGITFDHYLSAIKSVEVSNTDTSVILAIRKSVTGTAAKVVSALDFLTSKKDVLETLTNSFGILTDESNAWERFYAANQKSGETLIEWHTRVHMLYKATNVRNPDDMVLKSKLFNGLRDQNLKDSVLWKFEDDSASEQALFKLLRKISERKSGKLAITSATHDLEQQVEALKSQIAALSTKDESKEAKPKVDKFKNFNNKDKKNRNRTWKESNNMSWRDKDSYSKQKSSSSSRRNNYQYRQRSSSRERYYDRRSSKYDYHKSHKRDNRSPHRRNHESHYSRDRRSYSRSASRNEDHRDRHYRRAHHRSPKRYHESPRRRSPKRRYSPSPENKKTRDDNLN